MKSGVKIPLFSWNAHISATLYMQCCSFIPAAYTYVLLDEMFRIWSEDKEFSSHLELLWEFSSQYRSDSWKRICLSLTWFEPMWLPCAEKQIFQPCSLSQSSRLSLIYSGPKVLHHGIQERRPWFFYLGSWWSHWTPNQEKDILVKKIHLDYKFTVFLKSLHVSI